MARLAASRAGEPETLSGKILQGVVHSLDVRANAPGLADEFDVPAPVEALPWRKDPGLLQSDVAVNDSTVKRPEDVV